MVPCIEKRIPNNPGSVVKVFGKLFREGSVIACYEAGCMGFTLQRLLEGMGVEAIVAAPGKLPRKGSMVCSDGKQVLVLVL